MAKVAVVIIHGMGAQERDFADATIDEINVRIKGRGKQPADIAWKPVYWADLIQSRQTDFLNRIISNPSNDIDFIKLRRFVISALGDAAAYQNIRGKETSTYREIHQRVKASISDFYNNQLGQQPCPLIIMAHSLGGHVISNYIWDIQKDSTGSSDFENMKYLAGMITFGCNIPLFSFAHTNLLPFSFPGESLSYAEKAKAKWLNFYDPDDVLGYPLRQINNHYEFIEDRHINAGGLLTSWNPLSHNAYWTDNCKPPLK
ncbi:hypothetical protein QKW35_21125 [Pontibacterium granulatum]|uniref:hypothetical protein n=1 Tax=Pontibacterium granulatum TaxID=2036029 RepID=UPI00249B9161|nr:hypothetical protein [Pontibacterium granulatum]MDI3326886.1 hypothetical protein [Pontibacterium granulatum]